LSSLSEVLSTLRGLNYFTEKLENKIVSERLIYILDV
jgi:hypothetical protein